MKKGSWKIAFLLFLLTVDKLQLRVRIFHLRITPREVIEQPSFQLRHWLSYHLPQPVIIFAE
jgi:hypothetical protein